MTPAQHLRAAADLIEKVGHEQNATNGGAAVHAGPCCVLIALMRTCQPTEDTFDIAALALRNTIGGGMMTSVAIWSDKTPTAEVLATMRRVANELEAAS